MPTVTPLTSNYQLDEAAVEKMFQHFYASNAQPFILGTTGEAASIATTIKKQFVQKAAAIKKQGSLLYVGISSNCLENTVATINIKVVIIRYIFPKIELAIFNIIFEVGIIAEIYSDNKLDKLATEKAIAKETTLCSFKNATKSFTKLFVICINIAYL